MTPAPGYRTRDRGFSTEKTASHSNRLGTNSPGGVSSQDDIDRRVAAAVANVENGHKQTIVRLQGEMVEERRKAQGESGIARDARNLIRVQTGRLVPTTSLALTAPARLFVQLTRMDSCASWRKRREPH